MSLLCKSLRPETQVLVLLLYMLVEAPMYDEAFLNGFKVWTVTVFTLIVSVQQSLRIITLSIAYPHGQIGWERCLMAYSTEALTSHEVEGLKVCCLGKWGDVVQGSRGGLLLKPPAFSMLFPSLHPGGHGAVPQEGGSSAQLPLHIFQEGGGGHLLSVAPRGVNMV